MQQHFLGNKQNVELVTC